MISVLYKGKSEGLGGDPYYSNMVHRSKEVGYAKKNIDNFVVWQNSVNMPIEYILIFREKKYNEGSIIFLFNYLLAIIYAHYYFIKYFIYLLAK